MSVVADLLVRNARDVSREATDDALLHVGVQMRFEVRPIDVVASNNQALPEPALEIEQQSFGNRLEVLQSFVRHTPLCMPRFIAFVTITCRASWQEMEQGWTLLQIVEAEVKEAGPLTIDHRDSKRGMGS